MANTPGPQRALGTHGQTINASSWPYFDALIRAVVARTGVNYDALVVEGTRTYARQSYLYDGYRYGRIDPSTGRKFNPAYPPNSPLAYHVAGDAVDFGAGAGTRGTAVQRALHELGPRFGIFFEVSNELWHGRCDLARVPGTLPSGTGAKPIENEDNELTPDQDRKLTAVFEFLFAPGPENGGIKASSQIGGAFRDSATAMLAAQRGSALVYRSPQNQYVVASPVVLDIGNSNGTGLDGQTQVDQLVARGAVVENLNQIDFDRIRIILLAGK